MGEGGGGSLFVAILGGLVTTSIMGRPRTATTAMPRRQTHKPWVRMPRGVSKPRRSEDTLLGRMTASLGATKGQARRASRAAGLQRNGASRAAGLQRNGCRHSGNPHAVGYSCDFVTAPVPTELKFAKLTNGRPSIMRAIWRGMYRVRGREGDAVGESLGSRKLRTTLYRYTQQGGRSIYNLVNRMLARKKGKDLNDGPVRNWLIDLVMIVRLLWSVDGPDKLYRGVPRGRANAQIYRTARSSHMTVEWHALTSTSLDRHIALRFAGPGGVLFVIKRDPTHASAADVSQYSQFPNEQEVLLLPSTRFSVVNVQEKTDVTEVVLEEQHVFPPHL